MIVVYALCVSRLWFCWCLEWLWDSSASLSLSLHGHKAPKTLPEVPLCQNVAQVQIKGKVRQRTWIQDQTNANLHLLEQIIQGNVPLNAGLLFCAFSLTNVDQVYKQKKTGTSHVLLTFRLLSMFSRFMPRKLSISFKLFLCFLIFTSSQPFILFCVDDHAPYLDQLVFKSAMDQIWTAIAHFQLYKHND